MSRPCCLKTLDPEKMSLYWLQESSSGWFGRVLCLHFLTLCPGTPHLLHFRCCCCPNFGLFNEPFVRTISGSCTTLSLIRTGYATDLSFWHIASNLNVRLWISVIATLYAPILDAAYLSKFRHDENIRPTRASSVM